MGVQGSIRHLGRILGCMCELSALCAYIRSQIVIVGSVGTVDSLYNYIHPTYIKEFVCIPVDRVDQCPAHPPAISDKNLIFNAIEGGGGNYERKKPLSFYPPSP